MNGKKRIPFAEFVPLLDMDACKEILGEARSTLGAIPCSLFQHPGGKLCKDDDSTDTPPGPHEGCPRCFCWRSCTDHDCDHPACGRDVDGQFRDAFIERFPDVAALDVLMGRTEPRPIIEIGRLGILIDEEKIEADPRAGKAAYDAFSKKADWQQMYDIKGVADMSHVEAEIWLVQQGIAVEACTARYVNGFWVAMALAAGRDIEAATGGLHVNEFRLARMADLTNAPVLSQGALF